MRACLRQHLITDYLPGHCVYNLGEYPGRQPWNPDDWDERELDRLQGDGLRLIQVHEEWNDMLRRHGGDKYTPVNPKGFRRFADMVHRRGMKLIVYISTGFFERTDPDFREEWVRQKDLVEIYFHYARCSPASPSWRAYLLPRLMNILDRYEVDGFYNDTGYLSLAANPRPPASDEVSRDFVAGDGHKRCTTIGLISPYSEPFCAGCRRLRLTATGVLIGCLARPGGVKLAPLLRGGTTNGETIAAAVEQALGMKRRNGEFIRSRAMVGIGG